MVLWDKLTNQGGSWLLETKDASCTFDSYRQLCFTTKARLSNGTNLLAEAYKIMENIFKENN